MEIIGLEEVDSTNTYAKKNIDMLADGTVIYAKSQTSGRGRLNRCWVNLGEGNLFMTIVLKPSDTFRQIYPNITQYLSVALAKVLETYNLTVQIKWPNDVLIEGKKIAGILSESVMQGTKFKGLVLGVGVNLNSKQADLDKIPNKIATSLNIETNAAVDIEEFRTRLLEEFFKNYNEFLQTGFRYIKEDYIKRNCFLDKDLKVQVFDNIESGIAKSINDKGELELLQNNNKTLVLTIGDIL